MTGASSGIGLALVDQFAEHGFDLFVAAEDEAIINPARLLRGGLRRVEDLPRLVLRVAARGAEGHRGHGHRAHAGPTDTNFFDRAGMDDIKVGAGSKVLPDAVTAKAHRSMSEPGSADLPMISGGWLPRLIGGTAFLIAPAMALLPLSSAAAVPTPLKAPTVPDRMAGYSYLTGDVSAAPPGRAVALFQFGFGVELLDFPQAMVVGANDDVYRRVDLAQDHAGPETQGDPAPMLLSPDGMRVAVGDHDADRPDLAVLDLASGRVDLHPVPSGHSVLPLVWSPDGRRLAYLTSPEPTTPHAGAPITGDVGLLDVATG